MNVIVKSAPIEKQQNTCLIIGVYDSEPITLSAIRIDEVLQNKIKNLLKKNIFKAKIGQTFLLIEDKIKVLLVGCGKEKKVSLIQFKKIGVTAFKSIKAYEFETATCYLTEIALAETKTTAWKVKQLTEAASDAFYSFDMFKTKKENKTILKEVIIDIANKEEIKACEHAVLLGQAIVSGSALTKNLANTPSNICTPAFLADQAMSLAKSNPSITTKILNEKDMQHLGMGGILAVSQGSAQEPKLICIEYKGDKKKAPIALVGKGVTFDTGGNSLKPADAMLGMKYDMCGAATVMGVIKAAALLKLPVSIIGVIAAVENMPGGTAYKPEDIITTLSGKTVEVLNTDAEGRIILADALTYCERYKPEIVIDIATLTGAVVIALGVHATGLLSNDDSLAQGLLKAGLESNDRAWQLPLWEDYQEQLNSPFADMANVGGRTGGVITAACFLSRFTKKFKWAHLDIAGTAAVMTGAIERYATGRPVPLLTEFLINHAKYYATH